MFFVLTQQTIYTKMNRRKISGITFKSSQVELNVFRPMDLFAIAQNIFDMDGERLHNRLVATELLKMGKTEVEIIRDQKNKFQFQAI